MPDISHQIRDAGFVIVGSRKRTKQIAVRRTMATSELALIIHFAMFAVVSEADA